MECVISLQRLAESQHGQVKYASAFVDEHIDEIRLEKKDQIVIVHHSPSGNEVIEERVNRLIDRFSKGDFGFKENVLFKHEGPQPYHGDIIAELVDTKKPSRCLNPACSSSVSLSLR